MAICRCISNTGKKGWGDTDSFQPIHSVSQETPCSPPGRDSRSPGKGLFVGTQDPNYISTPFPILREQYVGSPLVSGAESLWDSLLLGFATIPELHHHDCDVIGAASVEGLQDDALGPEVGFIQALLDESDCLLVAESIPQTI